MNKNEKMAEIEQIAKQISVLQAKISEEIEELSELIKEYRGE